MMIYKGFATASQCLLIFIKKLPKERQTVSRQVNETFEQLLAVAYKPWEWN